MATEPDMGSWTDLLHSSTKLLEQASPSARFPPLQRNLDQLESMSKKLKAKTIRTEACTQSIATMSILARDGVNSKQLARDRKSFELKTTFEDVFPVEFEDVFPVEMTCAEESLQQARTDSRSQESIRAIHDWWDILPSRAKTLVVEAGFGGLLSIEFRPGDRAQFAALAERWSPTTNTFLFPIGEFGLTPMDFYWLTNISFEGVDISFDRELGVRDLHPYFGPHVPRILSGNAIHHQWLFDTFSKYDDTASEEEIGWVVRAFLMYVFCHLLFATPSETIYLDYLPSLKDVSKIHTFNWGKAALAHLYWNMGQFVMGETASFYGLCFLWELWSFEWFGLLAPKVIRDQEIFPHANKWAASNCDYKAHSIQQVREAINHLTLDDVVWRPWSRSAKHQWYMDYSSQRILLLSARSRQWYMGDRCWHQLYKEGLVTVVLGDPPPNPQKLDAEVGITSAEANAEGYVEPKMDYESYWRPKALGPFSSSQDINGEDPPSSQHASFTTRGGKQKKVKISQGSKEVPTKSVPRVTNPSASPSTSQASVILPLPSHIPLPGFRRVVHRDIPLDQPASLNFPSPPADLEQVPMSSYRDLLQVARGLQRMLESTYYDYEASQECLRVLIRPPSTDSISQLLSEYLTYAFFSNRNFKTSVL